MNWSRILPFSLALGCVVACQRPASQLSPPDIAAVKANYSDWATAVANRDYEAIARLVAEDEWISNPNEAPRVGREATVAWVKSWAPDVKQSWIVDEVLGYSDMAYSRATVTVTSTGPDGQQITEHAHSVNLHRRQPDGRWVFARSINHSIDPLPASPAVKTP